ncbi:Uma2 family endonuclease [Tellurirhabdus rosea]|uniref:Uma2 family endonuclease n=1 Tax=Tellurirhabdus rosea TaxID=2674997 RepID=UPI00225483B7|nr:Uma2 family endonuclease [Tellurirhabdus rosea]
MVTIKQETPRRRKRVPSYLVYETLNGRALYYRGYKEVLSGKKTFEEIMGSSSLQAALVTAIVMLLGRTINRKKYLVATNEAGLHIDKGNNFANDIAIYEKKGLTLSNTYFQTPPKIAIEVDVRIDLEQYATREQNYIHDKTDRLLAFGVERVIWIMINPNKVLVASRNADWITHNWDVSVPVLDEVTFNLADLLREEGIAF